MSANVVAWYRILRAWGWDPRFALRVARERDLAGRLASERKAVRP